MSRMIFCVKCQAEGEALARPPYPGELGKRIYEQVSQAGWQQWLRHQTILINEYRLSPIDPKARQFLEEQMVQFFFGEGAQTPEEFKAL